MPASKIAKEMGDVTRNGVIGKVHRLGIAGEHHADGKSMPARRRHRRKPQPKPIAPLKDDVRTDLYKSGDMPDLPPDQSPIGCTIMELQPQSCRWPIGDVAADMRYCGAQKWSGSYCRKHSAVAWKSGARI